MTCYCGHEIDEHVDGGHECDVQGCPCVHFELDESESGGTDGS